ncbi:MAG: tyrosine-type recombinase/integrase [Bacillota bacterium]|nr:tyrosine-type recombinase/integrase [Bacillota bacterium]
MHEFPNSKNSLKIYQDSVRLAPLCYSPFSLLAKFDNRLCKEAKISNANFHCLRHSFATRALEVGIPAKTVSEILGHSSVSFTLDVYSHVLPYIKKAAMEKLSPLFS